VRIGVLKPEEAAKKALANVAAFKKEEAKKALEAKRKPAAPAQTPVVDAPGAKPVSAKKEELNALLRESARDGKLDEVERLLKAGADIDAKNEDGENALDCARKCGHEKIVGCLRERYLERMAEHARALAW